MIVETEESASMWNTGNAGEKMHETKFKYISEKALKKILPKIYNTLNDK